MGYKAKRRWDTVLVYGALTVISADLYISNCLDVSDFPEAGYRKYQRISFDNSTGSYTGKL